MKHKPILIAAGVVGLIVLTALFLHLPHLRHANLAHANPGHGSEMVTIPLNETSMARCGNTFFDSFYQLTKAVFAEGADTVVLADYQEQVFSLIRNSEEFKDNPEPFIEHIKAIPGQIIDIVKEDPEVLDNCENFSVAMVGPQ